MDLRFSKEENAFRQELRTFFRTAVPESTRKKVMENRHLTKEDRVTSQKILHSKGCTVPHWPKEWGGSDWTPVQHYIFIEEMQLNGVPQPLAFNVSMNGPVIVPSAHRSRRRSSCRAWPLSTTGGARVSRSRARAPISPRSRRRQCARATTTSSTARRPGRRSRSTPTGSSASCAPIPRPRSSSASRTS